MCCLAIPDPQPLAAGSLIMRRRKLDDSLVGGIAETQKMLDFRAEHDVAADIERIDMADINDAFERMIKSDVCRRFVIDCSTIQPA